MPGGICESPASASCDCLEKEFHNLEMIHIFFSGAKLRLLLWYLGIKSRKVCTKVCKVKYTVGCRNQFKVGPLLCLVVGGHCPGAGMSAT